jgi:hypothetical protein
MTRIERITQARAIELTKHVDFSPVERAATDFCINMATMIWAGFIDDKLACIWGVIPPTLMSSQAYLWLYTTDTIKEHQFVLVRHSQLVIQELLKEYSSLCGHALLGSEKSIRWLKWLGAKFGHPQGDGVPFRISRRA